MDIKTTLFNIAESIGIPQLNFGVHICGKKIFIDVEESVSKLLCMSFLNRCKRILPKYDIQQKFLKNEWKKEQKAILNSIIKRYFIEYEKLPKISQGSFMYNDGLELLWYNVKQDDDDEIADEYGFTYNTNECTFCLYGGNEEMEFLPVHWTIGRRQKDDIFMRKYQPNPHAINVSVKLQLILASQAYYYKFNRFIPMTSKRNEQLKKWQKELWKPPNGSLARKSVQSSMKH